MYFFSSLMALFHRCCTLTMRSFLSAVVLATACIRGIFAVAPTDEFRDADVQQSGYLPNHNMDPAIVDSTQFGQLWKVAFNAGEQFYAKPLTYTPLAGGPQLLFLASSQNNVYTLNAATGAIIKTRRVHAPFLQSDIGCTDIPGTIGITGTPVIDPATDTAYFFSKTYVPNLRTAGETGVSNGVYYFHGVNIETLQDVAGFPILVDGTVAQNDPTRTFVGGVILQRPSLTQIGSVVYGGFGAHCDLFNYTGLVVGVDVNKAQVVTEFATVSGPMAPQSNVLLQNGGPEGGIWMSGMGLASDGQRLFFVTGNGNAHENSGTPASGSSGCHTLGEAVVNMALDSNGVLSVSDYFQPYDYQNMDAGDQDFGSGGIVLLDPTTFGGTGVSRMAVTAGKNGKIYVLNADDLGGYRLGTGQTDGILQTISTGKAIFGASGSYPLEGGYIYVTPVGYPTYAYQLGFTGPGVPIFSMVAQTNEVSAGRVGVGTPVVTTFKGAPGTAILWMTDPNAGIRAWYAVPKNGILQTIRMPQIGGAVKFQRPTFGDGRVYTTDTNGVLYCLGAPVAIPLNCTNPVDFGQVAIGSTAIAFVTCVACVAIKSINGIAVGDPRFVVSNSSLPTGSLGAGAAFTFPVTWDLTSQVVQNHPNASYSTVIPGIASTPLTIQTTNAVTGYATLFPISLTGTEISPLPFLDVTPTTVDYGGVIIVDPFNIPTTSNSFTVSNVGLGNLTILGYAYTYDHLDSLPKFINGTQTNGVWDLGLGFTTTGLPAIGSTIAGSAAVTVESTFDPIGGIGSYASYLQVWTTGGTVSIVLEGSASIAPIANFSISDGEGGWLPQSNLLMDFGGVVPGSTSSRQIQICNQGGSVLTIEKSKPPSGVFRISDPSELHESQQIPIGQCAYGTVLMVSDTEEYDLPDLFINNTWTLNTDDLNFGVHVVQIQGAVVSRKAGPVNPIGQIYRYLGCFHESSLGPRLLPNQPVPASDVNSNGYCQSICYNDQQYAFAGTEFGTECWCGNIPPPLASQDALDIYCNTACPGDGNDRCGAPNYLSVYYDPTKYVAGADPSLYGPQTIQAAGNYNYLGCYSEATTGRALTGATPQAPLSGFTIELCMAACQGYAYFGMEFANECYCGNTINAGSVNQSSLVPSVSGCSMICAGSVNEYCGGPNRLNTYMTNTTFPSTTTMGSTSTSTTTSIVSTSTRGPYAVQSLSGWIYKGCYTESTNGRALSGLENPAAAVPVSLESCGLACAAYTYFGVEYAGECYCGNSFGAGSVIAPGGSMPSANGCNMACEGNSSECCGGPARLNVYQATPLSTSLSSPSASPYYPASASSTGTPTPTGLITVTDFGGYAYLGCYSEAINMRALSQLQNPAAAIPVSVESCAEACAGYSYFGVEYSRECYCGNVINPGSAPVAGTTPQDTGCSMVCDGSPVEYCGGPDRLNMYMVAGSASLMTLTTTSTVSTPSTIIIASTTGTTSLTDTTLATGSTTLSMPLTSAIFTTSITPVTDLTSLVFTASTTNTTSTINLVPTTPMAYTTFPGNITPTTGITPMTGFISINSSNSTAYITSSTSITLTTSAKSTSDTTSTTDIESLTGTTLTTDATSTTTTSTTTTTSLYPGSFSSQANSLATTIITSTARGSSSAPNSSSTTPVIMTTNITITSPTLSPTGSSSTTSIPSMLNSSSSTGSTITTNVKIASAVLSSSSSLFTTTTTTTTASSVLPSSSSSPTKTTTTSTTISSSTATSSTTTSIITSSATTAPDPPSSGGSSSSNSSSSLSSTSSSGSSLSLSSSSPITLTTTSTRASATTLTIMSSSSSLSLTTLATSTMSISSSTTSSSSTVLTITTSATTSSTVPPATWVPTPGQSINSWTYLGCANETTSPDPRALSLDMYASSNAMTIESCQAFCADNNYALAGLEHSQECYCGNALQSHSAVGHTGCDMLCSGSPYEFCGGAGRLSVFSLDAFVAPSIVPAAHNYVYQGCYHEPAAGRLLPDASYSDTTGMTVESCIDFCATQAPPLRWAGVEYSQECYCAQALSAASATPVADSSCDMTCTEDPKELCGAAGLLNVYEYRPPVTPRMASAPTRTARGVPPTRRTRRERPRVGRKG